MKPEWIARQSSRPSAWLGEIVARVMSLETRAFNEFAASRLDVAPRDSVLEVGCGAGRNLLELAKRATGGFVAGIDPSDVMARLATRRLRHIIGQGRAEVHVAEAARLPFEAGRFDAAIAVHVIYFWPDPQVELREIRRVLRPGGTLALGFKPDGEEARAQLPAWIYHLRSVEEVEELLREAGFEDVEVTADSSPFVCVTARAAQAIDRPLERSADPSPDSSDPPAHEATPAAAPARLP